MLMKSEPVGGIFKTRVVHGMLLIGLISNVVGNRCPVQALFMKLKILTFGTCYINDTVRAQTEVIGKLPWVEKVTNSCYNHTMDQF